MVVTYTGYTRRTIQHLISNSAIPQFPDLPIQPQDVTLRQVLDSLCLEHVAISDEGPWSCAAGIQEPTPIKRIPIQYVSLQPHVAWAKRNGEGWVVPKTMHPWQLVQTGLHFHEEANVSMVPLAATLGASPEQIDQTRHNMDTFAFSVRRYTQQVWADFWSSIRQLNLPWPEAALRELGDVRRNNANSFTEELASARLVESCWEEAHVLALYQEQGGIVDLGKVTQHARFWVIKENGHFRPPDEVRVIDGKGMRPLWRLISPKEVVLGRFVQGGKQQFFVHAAPETLTKRQNETVDLLSGEFRAQPTKTMA